MYAGIILVVGLMLTPKHSDMTLNFDEIGVFPREVVNCTIEDTAAISDGEFELLCKCVEAEAGDHDFLGKCYVADVILNRVDDKGFPNTITEVINQHRTRSNGSEEWQFEVVKNGRIHSIEVSEETRRAVREELRSRKNYEILFFCMYDWFDWAEWLFQYPATGNNVHHFYK